MTPSSYIVRSTKRLFEGARIDEAIREKKG
jgi:hypothetical protein